MAKIKIKHTITKKEWNKKHKDFKLMGKDGIPYIMAYDSKIGTHLVPVKIIDEVSESLGAELDLIKQSSKDVRDFIKKVFSNSDFRDMKSDKDFLKYLKSIYEGVELESVNEAYIVTYAKKKGEKPASAAFQLRGSALSFEKDLKKDGYITMITQKKVKGIDESVNENDGVYFKSYTAAIEAARAAALKKGFEVEDDEMFTKVGMNSKRPSVGKTTKVSLELVKNGKPQRKMLHIQVYGMKNGYELNSYIN